MSGSELLQPARDRRKYVTATLVIVAFAAAVPSPARGGDHPSRTVLVKLSSRVDLRHLPVVNHREPLRQLLSSASIAHLEPVIQESDTCWSRTTSSGFDRIWRIEATTKAYAVALAGSLRAIGELVVYAELDGPGTVAQVLPNDFYFSSHQWGLHNTGKTIEGRPGVVDADIDAPEAWELSSGALPLVVAIVDTGVDPHPELVGRLLPGYATVGDPYDTFDTCNHGTHVAGIVAATRDNEVGIAGLHGCAQILPVRVFDGCAGSESYAAAGIVWAVDHGADIVLVPLAFVTGTQTLHDAVTYAVTSNVVIIASAGNDGYDVVRFPAGFDGCLAVSATTNQDMLGAFSNYGAHIDLSAPGESIWSTSAGGGYVFKSGTSASAAYAAGVAALVMSYAPQLTAEDVAYVLTGATDDLGKSGWDPCFGWGRLSACQALLLAQSPALLFEHVEQWPEVIPPDVETPIVVRILPGSEQPSPETAQLFYRTVSEEFSSSPMTGLGDALYEARLPAASCETVIEYYLGAMGDQGSWVFDPYDAPADLYAALATQREIIFQDDFEEDLGWETVAEGGEQTTGLWTRVIPNGNYAQPYFDFSPGTGRYCFITGQYYGGGVGVSDVDYGPVRLLSPVIAVSAQDAEVSYARWLYTASGQPDVLTVELSRDGGDIWATVEVVEATAGWETHGFRLSQFPEVSGWALRVRFSTADPGNDSLTEAGVDEFSVRAILCAGVSTIPGDGDGDGDVDLDDFAVMVVCLNGPGAEPGGEPCPAFDFDQDDDVDLQDFDAFMALFNPQP